MKILKINIAVLVLLIILIMNQLIIRTFEMTKEMGLAMSKLNYLMILEKEIKRKINPSK